MIEMGVNPLSVRKLILRMRALSDRGLSGGPGGEDESAVLGTHETDLCEEEIREDIDGLDEDRRHELVALM